MKTKLIIILSIALFVIISSLAYSFKLIVKLRSDKTRLTGNIETLVNSSKFYKTKSGKLAQDKRALQLTIDEFKDSNFKAVLDELSDLNIKVKRLESYTNTVVENNNTIETTIRDSVINDTVLIKVWDYKDAWTIAKGLIYENKQITKIQTTDSITQVAHFGKREKFWKIWRPRPLLQTITNKNPNNTIIFNEKIQIIK